MEADKRLLDVLKYRAYLVVLALGTIAAFSSWAVEQPIGRSNSLDNVIDPLLTGLCAVLTVVLLWKKEQVLRIVELVGYVGVAAYFLVDAYYLLYVGYESPGAAGELAEFFTWISVVYILAYLVFGARTGLAVSGLFYFSVLAISLPRIVPATLSGEDLDLVQGFVQLYLASAVIVTLLFIFARFMGIALRAYALNEAMNRLANTDFLTGIPNRRDLYEALEREVEESSRYGRPLSLIMFDLDHFKRINDSYGHDAGDRALQETTRLIAQHLRKTDRLSRWGGEEFLILAPETASVQAQQLAVRLNRILEGHDFERTGKFTASFGVAGIPREGHATVPSQTGG